MCEKDTKQIFSETIIGLLSEKGGYWVTKMLVVSKDKGLSDHPSKKEDIPKRHACSPPVLDWLSKLLTQWSPSNWNYTRKCYSGIRKRHQPEEEPAFQEEILQFRQLGTTFQDRLELRQGWASDRVDYILTWLVTPAWVLFKPNPHISRLKINLEDTGPLFLMRPQGLYFRSLLFTFSCLFNGQSENRIVAWTGI